MKRKYSLSVSDFAISSPLSGSIDNYSGFSEGNEIGIQLHQEIQNKRKKDHPSYISEVSIKHEFMHGKYIFEVRGRIDGLYRAEHTIIEEIKSAFNLNKLHKNINIQMDTHPFCLQLLTYGYIHWLKTNEIPQLNLHLVSSRNKKTIDLPLQLKISNYELWLANRLDDLVMQIKTANKRIQFRQKLAHELKFPFPNPRTGQVELIEALQKNFIKKHATLIQAPTGLGKTIGVLYPTLQEAFTRGQKVVYVTPKNSQHIVAQAAFKKIQEKQKINSMILTAKNKLCLKNQPICNSEFCEFAKDYYTKLTHHKVTEKLKKIKNLNSSHFKKMGLKYQVCPFELQMDYIPQVDTIICDYNYVFSPQANMNRVAKIFIGETEKPNLIIDECHNLPERAMGYYSPILSAAILKNWILSLGSINAKFQPKIHILLLECIKLIESFNISINHIPHKINPSTLRFKEMENKLRDFVTTYLESDIEIERDDIVLNIFNYWTKFTSTLEFVAESTGEFFTSYYPNDSTIKITCCDASAFLEKCYDAFQQVVGFSATLKPFEYYSKLSGLSHKNLKTIELSSAFAKSHRKLLIIPQVSSKYIDRQRNYPRIIEAIKKISHLKQGNYFVFFPSFDFLEKILNLYPKSNEITIIAQKRNMGFQEVEDLLTQLKNPNLCHLIFAVQGGILSEGIDYPGHMLIGALIVGVPLPMYDWEREQMKTYYQEKYEAGLDYAYTFPAMAKSIQSSGRVIRSEFDKGIIILMDHRFLQQNYSACMPKDWFENTPRELVSNTILHDINEFWEEKN